MCAAFADADASFLERLLSGQSLFVRFRAFFLLFVCFVQPLITGSFEFKPAMYRQMANFRKVLMKKSSTLKFIMKISFLLLICIHRSIILIFIEKKSMLINFFPRKIFCSETDFHFHENPRFCDEFQGLTDAHFTLPLTFSVQVDSQVLEDIHMGRRGNGVHAGCLSLAVDMLDGLRAHVQHQCIHQLDVVVAACLCRLKYT